MFFAPRNISEFVIGFATYPVSAIFDQQQLRDLSLIFFGRTRTNLVPIYIYLSGIFWFLATFIVLLIIEIIKRRQKNNPDTQPFVK